MLLLQQKALISVRGYRDERRTLLKIETKSIAHEGVAQVIT